MKLYGQTDIGKVRQLNQDCFYINHVGENAIAIVCDGMGGAAAGGLASETALHTIADFINLETLGENTPKQLADLATFAVVKANEEVYNRSLSDESLRGMGTTCSLMLFAGGVCHFANVGDSRIYVVNPAQKSVTQLSHDHSMVQMMVDRGEITAEEARVHPKRNYITRAVGVKEFVEVDVFTYKPENDDIVLICSDGFYGDINPAVLPEVLPLCLENGQLQPLIDMANDLGGSDNITTVLFSAKQQKQL